MSIRTYKKDHLKEHAGVTLVAPVKIDAPDSSDPLVFWTQHAEEPFEVNLRPLATGQVKTANLKGGGTKFTSFTGRPELIRQLAPAIEEATSYAAKMTVISYTNALRDWWRILDSVEEAAAVAGQPMTRVEDVRLLTQFHNEFAHSSGMNRQTFGRFRALVDSTLMALGVHQTFWESPEIPDSRKHIPPQEQRNALRFSIKRNCRNVFERWAKSDWLSQNETAPADPQEADLWRHVKYMRYVQKKTGKLLPTPDDLDEVVPQWALNSNGSFKLSIRGSIFPNHWDADAVWHQCLLNTGWNTTTLTNLDVTKKFLFDHFKDAPNDSHRRFVLSPQTYELVGEKKRAGGKEQFVTGQWKTLDGPGHLIKTYLERVEPLRKILKEQLTQEELKYKQLNDAGYAARTAQFKKVKTLEKGVRSVWLYVNRFGKIGWISNESRVNIGPNGKNVTFLDEVVRLLNMQLATAHARRAETKEVLLDLLSPVPHVVPKDFRVWFADYVYRTSNGNILQLKKALNHSWLGTSIGYTDTNILSREANDAARRFLNILVGQLDAGRFDLTILAHLYRHGELSPEQEELLAQARTLPKSRMNVACKDAYHPPAHIKATANKPCDIQRCLLCVEHAILLPESLDGIAMRVEELRALRGYLPIETWLEEMYEVELKNNLMALRKFELNQSLAARKRWAKAIACGDHYVPGLPLASSPDLMELV